MTEPAGIRRTTRGDVVAVLPVAVVVVATLALLYVMNLSPAGLHTWILKGDIDIALALVVVGALVFPAATAFACRIDHVATARISDHFRQCLLLYTGVALGTVGVANGYDNRGSVGYAIAGAVIVAALIGIVANALKLAVRGIRARAI